MRIVDVAQQVRQVLLVACLQPYRKIELLLATSSADQLCFPNERNGLTTDGDTCIGSSTGNNGDTENADSNHDQNDSGKYEFVYDTTLHEVLQIPKDSLRRTHYKLCENQSLASNIMKYSDL